MRIATRRVYPGYIPKFIKMKMLVHSCYLLELRHESRTGCKRTSKDFCLQLHLDVCIHRTSRGHCQVWLSDYPSSKQDGKQQA